MPKRPIHSALALAAILTAAMPAPQAWAQDIVIGTGSPSGVYFQVGRAICRVLNRVAPVEGQSCEHRATAGSIDNLTTLRAGEIQLGVVQSDWQFHAVQGSGPFAKAGPDTGLRTLFSVHGEPFTLVVRSDSGIDGFADLEGKRVNIGNPGSGQRGTMEALMAAAGWTEDTFALAEQLNASEHALALCHDRIDAIVYTVGHPNASISQATGLCDAHIADVSGAAVDALITGAPYYVRTEIPGGIYNANPEPVATFGVIATVVVSEATAEEVAYSLVSRLFANLDTLTSAHPAFASLEPATMVTAGLSAPLHPGAARYYREQGWIAAEAPAARAEITETAPEAPAGAETGEAPAEGEAAGEGTGQ